MTPPRPGPDPSGRLSAPDPDTTPPEVPGRQPTVPASDQPRASPAGAAPAEITPAETTTRPELEPLPDDGVLPVAVGTALWFVAFVVLLPFVGDLRRDGQLWWIATAATGFGLGLVGIRYCVRRRDRLRRL
jgi:Protein of unknown function (DUF2530)